MTALDQLRAGDEVVILDHAGMRGTAQRTSIVRVTPTQIVTKYEKFRKRDGGLVGAGPWDYKRVVPVDDPAAVIRLEADRCRVKRAKIENRLVPLPESVLDSILALIEGWTDGRV